MKEMTFERMEQVNGATDPSMVAGYFCGATIVLAFTAPPFAFLTGTVCHIALFYDQW
jgi:hypothetical protein